ncbi:putative bifunctional diguanylate cyclase/phosphodiesterase [Magnetofaba australis]|uniref:putative bifunctional diguanylate cyclase/phosphodiesterase n=1 Tax=Magnetofaba australis TaxID=1472297 RepID=UPI000A19EE01|nr:EAL domain-containing protein [Magnetofaba australis]
MLTGLPNRALFQDRLRHALAQGRRQNLKVALLFIDLDNFKTINDTLGHEYGDEALKQASVRLKEVVRDVDTVARLGGDEFTVIITGGDEELAEHVAERIVDDLSASFQVKQHKLHISASIGIAFFPDDAQDSASLTKSADVAMYRAKEQGRSRVEFFRSDLHVRLLKRAAIEEALRSAIPAKRLRLVYQPKYNLNEEPAMIGAEALLRWRDADMGDISPAEFIPIAEACGLIHELAMFVEDMLIQQVKEWRHNKLSPPPIAMNVSPRQLKEPTFAQKIVKKINDADIPHNLIHLEITENALLDSNDAVRSNLEFLAKSGIELSLDDFGTGYSSLSRIKSLPIKELKVDKSFVDGLGENPEDEAIALTVLSLTTALGLRSVAEGVENHKQLDWLRQHGCETVQGYLLQRPLESDHFEDLLAKNG